MTRLASCLLLLMLSLVPSDGAAAPILDAPCSSSSATESHTDIADAAKGYVVNSDQEGALQSATCPDGGGAAGDQKNVVEEACAAVAGPGDADGCTEQVCPGGRVAMVNFPVVNGVVDRNRGAYFCADPNDGPTIGSSEILREVKRIGLPVAKLSVQPPGGKTLVNFDTIFSTKAHELRRTLTLAGSRVAVRIWPSGFAWHWGDESQPLLTSDSGRAYERGIPMDDYITHQYVDADVTVRPRVDVTYSAEFRVGNGAWRPALGAVTIRGANMAVRIVEARPVLVGSD